MRGLLLKISNAFRLCIFEKSTERAVLQQTDGYAEKASIRLTSNMGGILLSLFLVSWAAVCCCDNAISTQRLSSAGSAGYPQNGVRIACGLFNPVIYDMVPDGANGAFVFWMMPASVLGLPFQFSVERVRPNGTVAWNVNGNPLGWWNALYGGRMVADGSGNVIITWWDETKYLVYAQKILSDGTVAWNAAGVLVCSNLIFQVAPELCADGEGGAIIAWEDGRNAPPSGHDIFVQRVLSDGTLAWSSQGIPICVAPGYQEDIQILSDSTGGAIVSWKDGRDLSSTSYDIYAQRVSPDGAALWTANGVPVSKAPGYQEHQQMVTDGGGGAIIIWEDGRDVDNNKADIYAQRIGNDGSVAWTTNGIPLCALPDYQLYPGIATDGLGGAIVTWSDARNRETSGYDIYAQRVNPDGSVAWPEDGVVFCDATGDQWGSGPVDFIMDTGIVSDGAGGAIVTWWDTRSVAWSDVYAQRILPEGVAVWDTNGIVVSNYTGQLPGGSPNTRNIITDGAGGAIIAWESNTPADITARPCFEQCD